MVTKISQSRLWIALLVAPLAVVAIWFAATILRQWRVNLAIDNARLAIRLGRYSMANRWADRSADLGASPTDVAILRIRVARTSGDEAALDRSIASAKSTELPARQIRRQRQLFAIQNGDATTQVADMARLLGQSDLTAGETLQAFADGFFLEGERALASNLADRWIRQQPAAAGGYVVAAQVSAASENWDEAETALVRAIELEPNHAIAHRELAKIYQAREAASLALKHFRHADRLSPDDRDTRLSIAALHLSVGDVSAGETMLANLIAQQPKAFSPRYTLASHHMRHRRADQVIRWLRPLLPLHQDDLSVNYLFAQAYIERGQQDLASPMVDRYLTARHALDRIEDRRVDDPAATDFETQKQIALTYFRYRWESSADALTRAFMMNPRDPEIRQAMALFDQKQALSP